MPLYKTKTPDPIGDWANRSDSVFDSTPEKLARKVARFVGIGDPMSEVMSLAGPLGLGIVKTATPAVVERTGPVLQQLAQRTGKWLENGIANEAVDWFAQRFPRHAQQTRWVMDPTLKKKTLAQFNADTFAPYRAGVIRDGGPRYTSKMGAIHINPHYYGGEGAAGTRLSPAVRNIQVGDAVDSVVHEGQHLSDFLRVPEEFEGLYGILNRAPYAYEVNPFENLANISGSLRRADFLRGRGVSNDVVQKQLHERASRLRQAFAPNDLDAVDDLLPTLDTAPSEEVLRALRAPNRAVIQQLLPVQRKAQTGIDNSKAVRQVLRNMPAALRSAILQQR